MNDKSKYPLVSIAIPNYNYGRYLAKCFDSILAQTYPNIEVLFRDNASTDNSMNIAIEYECRFRKIGYKYSFIQNKRNIGSEQNTRKLLEDVTGDFFYVLASDDSIEPTMVEECVKMFMKYPSVGMVMTSRIEIDDDGNENIIKPFYNCDCVIPGDKQAAVFMMSGIAIPGERMMRRLGSLSSSKFFRPYQVAGDWFQNYLITCNNDIGYISKPLCRYRVHTGNETNVSEKELLGVFEHYKLINHMKELGYVFNQKEAVDRYDEAVCKLGFMCLRYAMRFLKHGEKTIAVKYLTLAPVFNSEIVHDDRYMELCNIVKLSDNEIADYLKKNEVSTVRMISYDPPQGSIIIREDNDYEK